jgi:hypothetical protein
MKHTPGPWSIWPWHEKDERESFNGFTSIANLCFVSLSDCEENIEEAAANARLMAAAPELLAALQQLCAEWDSTCRAKGWEPDHMSGRRQARAAIRKATGEQE